MYSICCPKCPLQYAELHCLSCYSFLRGASHPHELVERAAQLGYGAIAITDECSLAGIVKAHVAAREVGIQLVVGSEFQLEEGVRLLALVPNRAAYSELSGLISRARRRSPKGEYRATLRDVIFHLKRCLLIWLPRGSDNVVQILLPGLGDQHHGRVPRPHPEKPGGNQEFGVFFSLGLQVIHFVTRQLFDDKFVVRLILEGRWDKLSRIGISKYFVIKILEAHHVLKPGHLREWVPIRFLRPV